MFSSGSWITVGTWCSNWCRPGKGFGCDAERGVSRFILLTSHRAAIGCATGLSLGTYIQENHSAWGHGRSSEDD